MTAPLTPTQQKEEWKVFCPICNSVSAVYYPHSGSELCERCKPEVNVGQTTENLAVAPPNERRVAQRRKIVTTYLCNGLPIENAPDCRTIHPADRRQLEQSNE